ncbi:hypothetical protein M422DRAFT_185223 [Sphaerobolus stellatus SS14]|uniref:Uncharacterized protein n=1 Tax=Sphaerobolus stellatus (strain SS14) TaxID=990650 RepID=A0A0C9TPH4_SPHS4|nr:hypothetical protein M422DRAFT_185223 [Sphaerobolus stellatus SS14]
MTLKPIKPFHFHDPKDFIASLISRPGMESILDAYWKRRVKQTGTFDMKDLGDGSLVKELLDVDLVTRFADGPEDIGRLIFGVSIDWYNPYTMRIRGPSVSAGVIVIICLNLPAHLRYLPENITKVGSGAYFFHSIPRFLQTVATAMSLNGR